MIEIQAFPASYGESILITLGENESKKNMLIDTGFASTYNNHIKNKLLELKKANLALDLLVFTHFDADHIGGGISLLKDNKSNDESKIISIKNIWLNGINKLDFYSEKQLPLNEKTKKKLKIILEKKYPNELFTSVLNDVSAEQSLTLSKLISDGGYNINKEMVEFSRSKCFNLDEYIKIKVLSPTKGKIENLKKLWIEELIKMGVDEELNSNEEVNEAFEKIMINIVDLVKKKKLNNCSTSEDIIEKIIINDRFYEDESQVNGSSIAFTIECEGKKMLFLGDSHSDTIEKYIESILLSTKEKKLKFDLVKISHHGSGYNTSTKLLELIDCDNFLICTNGKKFSHPDEETLARIINSNEGKHKKIYLNYKTQSVKKFINNKLMKKYNYSIEFTNDINISNKKCKTTNIVL
ncbi:MBL fold metallo-hydrolase [uncultured Clostridium sp.]|uniref:ComEC/Rec2 family competence protein n=1 Tax=uncultured Clostridium sp. TaxID=59620 RepID=UPI0028E2533A|nr:MBL fold metallo-hydrolase [uncultured Clostridium sp.]